MCEYGSSLNVLLILIMDFFHRRYNFKSKKRRSNEEEERELEESVRTLTSLLTRAQGGSGLDLAAHAAHAQHHFHSGADMSGVGMTAPTGDDEPLEARVAAISAEIAAAIAQAQSRMYHGGEDDEEDDDGEGETGPESGDGDGDGEAEAEWLGPLVSGIRNEPERASAPTTLGNRGSMDDDDDGDDFPIPLRQRRQNNATIVPTVTVSTGLKRKR